MFSSLQIAARLLAGPRRNSASLLRRRKTDACASRLRKTDGDGLLGRSRAVLAATDVVNLFSDEFSSYGRGRFALARRLARALDGSLFRHVGPPGSSD
jgi:hypothetical protein